MHDGKQQNSTHCNAANIPSEYSLFDVVDPFVNNSVLLLFQKNK